MIIVSGRDFRANQSKYVGYAHKGENVVVKSRVGAWRVVPVTDSDIIVKRSEVAQELCSALIEAVEAIEGKRKLNTLNSLINELRDSDN